MTHREIELLTGTKSRQDQVELLREKGIPLEVSPLGIPKVRIEEVDAKLQLGDELPWSQIRQSCCLSLMGRR